jgi:hypothetical protein
MEHLDELFENHALALRLWSLHLGLDRVDLVNPQQDRCRDPIQLFDVDLNHHLRFAHLSVPFVSVCDFIISTLVPPAATAVKAIELAAAFWLEVVTGDLREVRILDEVACSFVRINMEPAGLAPVHRISRAFAQELEER